MIFHIDVAKLEDQVLNPLNSILLLCYGNDVYKDVEKEIRRIVSVLEKRNLINKRVIAHAERFF